MKWGQAPHRGQYLTHLKWVQIDGIFAKELDLSDCTQLGMLVLFVENQQQRLVLPFGQNVCLNMLELNCTPGNRPFVLDNLSLACSVTEISLHGLHARNLTEADWPCDLPQLESS